MGDPNGFIKLQRATAKSRPIEERLKNYREFVDNLSDEQASQQGSRCMDCGIPFCQTGCPVNNIIPDWNDLTFNNNWKMGKERLSPCYTTRWSDILKVRV